MSAINSDATQAGFSGAIVGKAVVVPADKGGDAPLGLANQTEQPNLSGQPDSSATAVGFRPAADPIGPRDQRHSNPGDSSVANAAPGGEALSETLSKSPKSCSGDPWLGTVVGNFRIESVIASGGMGTVYKAIQQQPVRRPVALKMIRHGMADQSTINRFLVERQSLALMDHPDIARVYEAGTTQPGTHKAGNPYFAMEYCEGLPIDQYCNDRSLGLRERIELVSRIACAVQRAHSHGIVHRDLKPGNVLVSDCEGRPNLKVIDFGIAKFTDEEHYNDVFGSQTDHATRVGEMVGTPAYMSPEQAAGAAIDARTDVFAIGAILFKLLTGTTPLTAPPEDCESLADLILHIQSFEPTTPTQRLRTIDPGVAVEQAALLGFDKPRRLVSAIRGDLDWVTLRAIESDKLRRYATADDLADDLQRYLGNQPVVAAGPSKVYRFKKFCHRRRAVLLGAAAVTVTMLIASGIAGYQKWQNHQRMQIRLAQTSQEATGLLERANEAIARAGVGGPRAEREFVAAQTAVAKVESLLLNTPSLTPLHERLLQTQSQIEADQEALLLVSRLGEARERAAQVDSGQHADAFGRGAGLNLLTEAFQDFGVAATQMSATEAAKRFEQCPPSLQPKLIESLDFLLNETPVGAGLYLHHHGGQISVASIVQGGAADQSKQLRVGDRLVKINDVDLVESFASDQIRPEAYRMLAAKPGSKLTIHFVRDLSDVQQCELECGGESAYWAHDVLAALDANQWRRRLRSAVLQLDLPAIRQLAESDDLASQPPGSLIQLAGTLFLLERTNDSIRFLELAQRHHPGNFWANHYLGTALAAAHEPPRPQDSLRYLTAAVSLRPQSVGARINLVEGLVRSGDHSSAVDHIQVAMKLAPHYRPLQQRMSALTAKNALNTSATQRVSVPSSHANQAINETALPPIVTAVNAGQVHGDDVSFEQIEANAWVLAAKGDRDAAMALVRKTAAAFPGDARIRRLKGVVLLELQDYVAARIALSDAARRLPNDAASRFFYGVALEYSGDSQAAIHEYEAALQLRPDYQAVREFLDSLRNGNGQINF